MFSSNSTANAHVNELREAAGSMSSRVDALTASETNAGRQPDSDLQQLRQQLQFLKNELNSQTQVSFILKIFLTQVHSADIHFHHFRGQI